MFLEEAEKERKKSGSSGHSLSFQIMEKKCLMGGNVPIGGQWRIPRLASRLDPASELLQHAKVGNRSVSMALVS